MDCKLTEIKKNFKGFAPWLHRLRSDDFELRTELLEKMEVACYLGQVFEFAPFASFPGNDEDIMVSYTVLLLCRFSGSLKSARNTSPSSSTLFTCDVHANVGPVTVALHVLAVWMEEITSGYGR